MRPLTCALILALVAGLLIACAGGQPADQTPVSIVGETRTDSQGAVVVEITPQSAGLGEETLIFSVVMNTHVIELDMDLGQLATLSTDTGLSVEPLSWETPGSGHHVTGTLTFPAAVDGKSLLDGATELRLVIREVDVPERVFTWKLGP